MSRDFEREFQDILEGLRMETQMFYFSRFGLPWAIGVPPSPFSALHVIRRGQGLCLLPQQFTRWSLAEGDAIFIPTGQTHIVSNDGSVEPTPLQDFLAGSQPQEGELWRSNGAGPLDGELLCGIFELQAIRFHPLFRYLPPAFRLAKSDVGPWLEPLLEAVQLEYSAPRPGSFANLARLSDLLFSGAMRSWLGSDDDSPWLKAFKDEDFGKVLAAIHRQPGDAWTVADLAGLAGMSRSLFARAFREKLTTIPLAYVMEWRLWKAYQKLRDGEDDLPSLARSVGFSCDASLARAVRRRFGVPPGELRRRTKREAQG